MLTGAAEAPQAARAVLERLDDVEADLLHRDDDELRDPLHRLDGEHAAGRGAREAAVGAALGGRVMRGVW